MAAVRSEEETEEQRRARILAEIAALEAELGKVKDAQKSADDASDAIDCISSKFSQASDLYKKAGTISGVPLDQGMSSIRATQLDKINTDLEKLSTDLGNRAAEIQAKIDELRAML